MKLLLTPISVFLLSLIPMNSNAANASYYIADRDYLIYRHRLTRKAVDGLIEKRRLDSSISVEELNKILKAEVEKKLEIYREGNGLDENGVPKND